MSETMMAIIPVTNDLRAGLQKQLQVENASKQSEWFSYCCDEACGERGITLVALKNDIPVGFISILFKASYPPFITENIPEIHGITVVPSWRCKGIAKQLLFAAEEKIKAQGYSMLGLGVGVTQDYQPALALYTASGYRPDGKGLYHASLAHEFVNYGDTITINASTTLWFVKNLD